MTEFETDSRLTVMSTHQNKIFFCSLRERERTREGEKQKIVVESNLIARRFIIPHTILLAVWFVMYSWMSDVIFFRKCISNETTAGDAVSTIRLHRTHVSFQWHPFDIQL